VAEHRPEQFNAPLPAPKSALAKKAERRLELQEFWHMVFLYDKMTMEEKEEFSRLDRLVMAFRLCREMCRIKGILGEEEPLCSTIGQSPSPWVCPVSSCSPEVEFEPGQPERLTVLLGSPTTIYPPEDDEDDSFLLFFSGVNEAANKLMLGHTDPFGSTFLLNPAHRALWPSPYQILSYENKLLAEITKAEMEDGQVIVRDMLASKGFLTWEIESLIKTSRRTLVQNVLMSAEEATAILMLRIESLIQRCRKPDGGDIRAELASIKLMAWLQGLHRREPEDGLEEIADIVKNTELKEKKGLQ